MIFKRPHKLDEKGFGHHIVVPALVIVLVALVGVRVLNSSHAASLILPPNLLQKVSVTPTTSAIEWRASSTPNVSYKVLRNNQVVGTTDAHTTNFIDSGLLPGTAYSYAVQAYSGTSISQSSVALSVVTPVLTTILSACGQSAVSGENFVLSANVSYVNTTGKPCINFVAVSNVSLNCHGHSIIISGPATTDFITMYHVTHFSLINCTFVDTSPHINTYYPFDLNTVTYGIIKNNTFGSPYATYQNASTSSVNYSGATLPSPGQLINTNLIISNNKFINSTLECFYVSNSFFGKNSFSWDVPGLDSNTIYNENANLGVSIGSNNIIYNNTIDGGAPTTGEISGLDDGILIDARASSGDTSLPIDNNIQIINNSVSHNFDAAIETAGTFNNSLIANNSINYAGQTAIGSYYGTSWQNDSVVNNQAINQTTGRLLMIFYTLNKPDRSVLYFQNNVFNGNSIAQSPANTSEGIFMDFSPTDYPNLAGIQLNLGNNLIENNNLTHDSTMMQPHIEPTSMVTDGGNNVCTSTPTYYPLALTCH